MLFSSELIPNRCLGKLPEAIAERFVFDHPLAELGSRSADGSRRVVTSASQQSLQELVVAFAAVAGLPFPEHTHVSIPVLSPGIKDGIPCVPCQKTHDQEWADLPATINEHQALLSRFVNGKTELPPVPECSRSGIVYVGGGKYWAGVVVGIRMLRSVGCNLPVQVWYRGEAEPVNPEQVKTLGDVELIDTVAHAVEHGGARILGGWESKLWALVHCGFERVLYLDADAYVVANPCYLFNELKTQEPFQFWRENELNHIKWEKVWKAGANGVDQIQGGHLLIDIPRSWKLLCIAHWMNQHSDFYYKHMFGDQDVWRVALAAMSDRSLWRCRGLADWQKPAFVISENGKPIIVHRCQDKMFTHSHLPSEREVMMQFAESH